MNPNFSKSPDGLLPAIIQNASTGKVLMLGYMNEEAFAKTQAEEKVTFFSRSKQRLWTKGETSDNFLHVVSVSVDCDQDTILIQANPDGPTCHEGTETCFKDESAKGFLFELERIIADRKHNPKEGSYTNELFNKGTKKIAQKVGEEATEVILEAMEGNWDLLMEETSDLLYHLITLLQDQGVSLEEVEKKLRERHSSN
ncbi:MAG: bifunctional phosphoribosyl-AMP cyclohydrolase/phosphoribosyl-ATP diphosphatase HisIE [Cyclobacteriaceae bacterium]